MRQVRQSIDMNALLSQEDIGEENHDENVIIEQQEEDVDPTAAEIRNDRSQNASQFIPRASMAIRSPSPGE